MESPSPLSASTLRLSSGNSHFSLTLTQTRVAPGSLITSLIFTKTKQVLGSCDSAAGVQSLCVFSCCLHLFMPLLQTDYHPTLVTNPDVLSLTCVRARFLSLLSRRDVTVTGPVLSFSHEAVTEHRQKRYYFLNPSKIKTSLFLSNPQI